MRKNILIVGGTSGLGLELAKLYAAQAHAVCVTGRNNPNISALQFFRFAITERAEENIVQIDALVAALPNIHTLIYAAGYFQPGHIDELGDAQILQMIQIGVTVPALLIRRLKPRAPTPLKIMLITSTSQFTPREHEPIYTAAKAGLGMLGASLALDPTIGKVLVVAPSGMRTPFWSADKDTREMLDPKWVAAQIIDHSSGSFKYRFAKILRAPARVEIVESWKPLS